MINLDSRELSLATGSYLPADWVEYALVDDEDGMPTGMDPDTVRNFVTAAAETLRGL